MNFWSYFYASIGAILSIITYAIYTREQFYPTMLFLTTSKISLVIACNMILSLTLLFGRISKHIFLGNLRDAETELLLDRAKYTVTETCLALTIFRNELTLQVLVFFCALLFVKSFHWLCSSRMDYLEQIMPVPTSTHIRLTALMTVLGICDISVAYYCIQYTITNGKSVLILFGFEFGVLVINVLNLFARYILHLIDMRFTNGLVSKGLYVMLVDLICDALRFLTYVAFFCLVFVYYGLPIHIIREVWVSFYTFQKHAYSFYKYVKLTNNLEQRFENASEEELHSAGNCLICREGMEDGKKLPCSHVFHLGCLRMWLQHQQSCPLCRAEIPLVPPTIRPSPRIVVVEEEDNVDLIDVNPLDDLTPEDFDEIQSNKNTSSSNSIFNDEQLTSLNTSINNQSYNINEESKKFPHFFITTCQDLKVYTEANITSTIIRPIVLGTVLFIRSRVEDEDGTIWLQTPDGWIIEKQSQSTELLLSPFKSNTNITKSRPKDNSIDINKLISKPIKINNKSNQLLKNINPTSIKINEDNSSLISEYTTNAGNIDFEFNQLETTSDKLHNLQSQFQQISNQLNNIQRSVCSCQKVINEIILEKDVKATPSTIVSNLKVNLDEKIINSKEIIDITSKSISTLSNIKDIKLNEASTPTITPVNDEKLYLNERGSTIRSERFFNKSSIIVEPNSNSPLNSPSIKPKIVESLPSLEKEISSPVESPSELRERRSKYFTMKSSEEN